MNPPAAQHEFAFVAVLPGPRARAERKRKAAAGDRNVEPPMYFCEVKPSLLPREAAADLGCSVSKILELIEEARLDSHPISAAAAKRGHVRISAASVAAIVNTGRTNGHRVAAFEKAGAR